MLLQAALQKGEKGKKERLLESNDLECRSDEKLQAEQITCLK